MKGNRGRFHQVTKAGQFAVFPWHKVLRKAAQLVFAFPEGGRKRGRILVSITPFEEKGL